MKTENLPLPSDCNSGAVNSGFIDINTPEDLVLAEIVLRLQEVEEKKDGEQGREAGE